MLKNGAFLGVAAVFATTLAHGAEMDRVLVQSPSGLDPTIIEGVDYTPEHHAGFVEGGFGYARGQSGGFDADGTAWALRGSVNTQTARNVNFQIDAGYSRMNVEGIEVDTLIGAAHAYYRQTDAYAVGAFVQGSRLGSNVLDLLAPAGFDSYAFDVVAGAEAALYTDQATFYAQLGFGQLSYSGLKADHLLAKGGARLYASDNLRFDVEGSLNRLSVAGADANIYSLSGTGNYRLTEFPATVFAGYRYDHAKAKVLNTSVGTANAHNFMTGLRFHFGSDSLKDEERRGPAWTLSTLNM